MSFLDVIPDVICIEILCKWIETTFVVHFDTSLTSHEIRQNFLGLISSSVAEFEQVDLTHKNAKEIETWSKKRKIKFQSISLDLDGEFRTSVNLLNFSKDNLTTFECKHIADKAISDKKLALFINKCYSLKSLTFDNIQSFTDSFLALIRHRLKRLHSLSFERSCCFYGPIPITDKGITRLANNTGKLETLHLELNWRTEYSDTILNQLLCANPKLKSMTLKACKLKDSFLATIVESCHCLKFLTLCACQYDFTMPALANLINNTTQLSLIEMYDDKNEPEILFKYIKAENHFAISNMLGENVDIPSFFRHLTVAVKSINLHNLFDDDVSIYCKDIAVSCPQLESFELDSGIDLEDIQGIKYLFKNCQKLRHLGILWIDELDIDTELLQLFDGSTSHNIENLKLEYIDVKIETIQEIVQKCDKLELLIVECHRLNADDLMEFVASINEKENRNIVVRRNCFYESDSAYDSD